MGKFSYSLPPVVITASNLGKLIQAATSLRTDKGWVKIVNETPYQVTAKINTDSVTLEPQEINGLRLDDTTNILYVIANPLLAQQDPPSSTLWLEVHVGEDMPVGVYPVALPRQTSQSNFVGNQQAYQVYENTFTTVNGAHSEPLPTPPPGQAMYVKRVEFSSGSIGGVTARCDVQLQGVDINSIIGLPRWAAQVPANAGIPLTRLEWPGPVKGITGQAMTFSISAPTGTFVALNVYYFFAAAAAIGGLLTTATLLQNDGNTAGTVIIEATPSGGASTNILTNDGLLILPNNKPLSMKDTGGIARHILKMFTDNDAYLITTPANGNLKVSNSAESASIATFNDDLSLTLAGIFKANSNAPANTQNGTSGTVSFYTPVWGAGLKVLLIVFNGFADNISAHTFALPTTISWGFWANGNLGVARIQFQSGGVSRTLSQISALGAGNGSSVGVTNASSNAIGQLVSTVDTVLIATSAQGAASSIFVLVGV